MTKYIEKLENSNSLAEIFEIVKGVIRENLKRERTGLMLGLAEMGSSFGGFVGAFHPVGSNIIVMNKTPLRKIQEINEELYNAYVFHILLHEYLHTLGILDEDLVRFMTYEISKRVFGENHPVTKMSKGLSRFFPELASQHSGEEQFRIDLVEDFDHSGVTYIG